MKPDSIHTKTFACVALLLMSLLLAGCALSTAEATKGGQTTPSAPAVTAAAAAEFTPTPTRSGPYLPQVQNAPSSSPTPWPSPTPVLVPFDLPKGPTLIYTGKNTEMRIIWQWTSTDTNFILNWGPDENYSQGSVSVQEYNPEYHLYGQTITGLQPATLYHYRVLNGLNVTQGTFRTAPASAETTLKFVSYGDTRTNPNLHDTVAKQVIDLYQSEPLYQTFNLMVGDFVNYGDEENSWNTELFDPQFKNIRAQMANIAWLPVMGNHEGGGVLFTRFFPLEFVAARFVSFDYGPAHIVLLDQYTNYSPGSPQYQWLEADLSANLKPWKFVVLHEPGWSAGGGHENNTQVQTDLEPLFEKYGVAIVFGGHNHYYARAEVNGVIHLTVGTGGAPSYTPIATMPNIVATSIYKGTGYARFEINGPKLYAQFVGSDGQIKDSFEIQH